MNNVSINFTSIQGIFNPSGVQGAKPMPADQPDVMPGVQPLLVSGDPGAMLAALTMESAHEQASLARQQRTEAEQAQVDAEHAEIQDLHKKADLQRIEGAIEGALDIAKGACDVGSGLAEAHSASETAEAGAERQAAADGAKDGTFSEDHVEALNKSASVLDAGAAKSKANAAGWTGAGAAFGAAKAGVGGLFQGAITDKDADEKMHEASADTFKKIAESAHDDEKDAHDLMSKALDFYKEYVDTKNQTAMAATHRA